MTSSHKVVVDTKKVESVADRLETWGAFLLVSYDKAKGWLGLANAVFVFSSP